MIRPTADSPTHNIRVRHARPDEAAHLTALGLRSNAYWGYDAAFMAACVPPLTVTARQIAASDERYFVAEDATGLVQGYAALRVRIDDAELTSLFVEPGAIGQGYGWRLWQHAVEVACSLGARRLRIEADPFAEAFYLRQGAERIGETPSDAIPGRLLPLLSFTIEHPARTEA
jgi:GNAT superfamily N-acetyltransferase